MDGRLDERVEALFLNAKRISSGSGEKEAAASGKVGLTALRRVRDIEKDSGGGDSHAVFVGDGDGEAGRLRARDGSP